jgi:hypothetical protein
MSEFTVTRTLKAPYERVPNPGSPRMRPDTTCRFPSSRNTGRWPPTPVTGRPVHEI